MDTKRRVIIAVIIVAALGAVLFAFSGGERKVVVPARERVRNETPPQEASRLAEEKKVVDYQKILEKFKGLDVESVPVSEKVIALTFDGGGNADSADVIVETLARENVPATFFLTGKFIERFPDSVAAVRGFADATGSELANHTYSHADITVFAPEHAKEELSRAAALCSCKPFFRFPYGARTPETIALVNDLGYTAVRWSVDSWGWQGGKDGRDAVFIADRVVSKATPGGIVLMHLGSAKDKTVLDADALSDIIVRLRAEGYRFVTLSEMFGS